MFFIIVYRYKLFINYFYIEIKKIRIFQSFSTIFSLLSFLTFSFRGYRNLLYRAYLWIPPFSFLSFSISFFMPYVLRMSRDYLMCFFVMVGNRCFVGIFWCCVAMTVVGIYDGIETRLHQLCYNYINRTPQRAGTRIQEAADFCKKVTSFTFNYQLLREKNTHAF